jgi:hypothetical protein
MYASENPGVHDFPRPGTARSVVAVPSAALEEPAQYPRPAPGAVFPGDSHTGVKDPIVQRRPDGWHAWICCHPLDEPDEEDRMTTAYATSSDGLAWTWRGTVLRPRPGKWDARRRCRTEATSSEPN